MEELLAWKDSSMRKPLLLHGARQTGKTHLITQFGTQHFDDMAYFDFESSKNLSALFEQDITPKELLPELELRQGKPIIPGKTLIFFDEVQAQGRALTSLKYFCEQAPEYHIVAAGSLLGVAIASEKVSFPVGKVNHLNLNPLDFEEFLWALDQTHFANAIRDKYVTLKKFTLHEKALDLYRTYLVCGGMPAAVLAYRTANNLDAPGNVHRDIEKDYVFDITKYADKNESAKILSTWRSVPDQLTKENPKFKYSIIERGARSSRYKYALSWLEAARMVTRCTLVEEGFAPLKATVNSSSFKLFRADTGMLCTDFEVSPLDIRLDTVASSNFRGALAENYVMQQLTAHNIEPYYWGKTGGAEVDFVFTDSDYQAIPVEVKSSDKVRSKSLNSFINKYKPVYAIRISTKNFGFENNIKSVPLYAAFCIE
jgi:predicted AAA+ superfamily ATPase